MTEQQMDKLKEILASSPSKINSTALDRKILKAANANVVTKKETNQRSPQGSFSAASLAILLTTSVYLSLNWLVSVKDIPKDLLGKDKQAKAQINEDISNNSQSNTIELIKSTKLTEANRPENFVERGIFTSLDFPSVDTILNNADFTLEIDRVVASKTLTLALNDIDLLIRDGKLEHARDRYHRLRQSCLVCNLPETLEALALSENQLNNRG